MKLTKSRLDWYAEVGEQIESRAEAILDYDCALTKTRAGSVQKVEIHHDSFTIEREIYSCGCCPPDHEESCYPLEYMWEDYKSLLDAQYAEEQKKIEAYKKERAKKQEEEKLLKERAKYEELKRKFEDDAK